MPNLRAFEVFLSVVEAGSISRAARKLHLTQPAVSHQVSSLERDLGVAVFDRGRRGATLTPAGRAFAPLARDALDAAVRAEEAARGSARIRLVVAQTFTVPFVVPALRALGGPLPEISEGSSALGMVEEVRRGTKDVAIVPGPVDAPDLVVQEVGTEEIVVVVGSPDTDVTLETVATGPLIGISRDTGYGSWLDALFVERGLVPVVTTTVGSPAAAAALASAGFGFAVVPESTLTGDAERSRLRPRVNRDIVVVGRSEEAVGPFVEALKSAR
jgi:DNA-binding transcriptional LysR family regulator